MEGPVLGRVAHDDALIAWVLGTGRGPSASQSLGGIVAPRSGDHHSSMEATWSTAGLATLRRRTCAFCPASCPLRRILKTELHCRSSSSFPGPGSREPLN
eukprot:9393262-Pyramimonas_sp.AAC.1